MPYKVVRVPEVEAVRRQVHVLLPEVEGPHVLRVVRQPGAVPGRGEVAVAGFGGRGAGAAVRAEGGAEEPKVLVAVDGVGLLA